MPTNITVHRDPRTNNDEVVYACQITMEALHDIEREVRFAGDMRYDFTQTIGERLRSLAFDGPAWRAWLELPDPSNNHGSGRAFGYDNQNQKHQVGLVLASLPELAPEMCRSLISLDYRCSVRYECSYNMLDRTVTLYTLIQVPMSLTYQMGAGRVGGSHVGLEMRRDFVDHFSSESGMRMVDRRMEVARTTDITLGGVSLGQFSDTQINVSESMLTPEERENIRKEAEALKAEQNRQQLERQKAILRADEALKKPQGTLVPRRTKRVSVATEAPALEAESPRRMKIRRDREN